MPRKRTTKSNVEMWCGALKKCKAHPEYQAKRVPKADCLPCWLLWIAGQMETSVYDDDVAALLKFAKACKDFSPKDLIPEEMCNES